MAENNGVKTLENGDIYFFYRPKIGTKEPSSKSDIQRFFIVLHPSQMSCYRLLTIGKKELPDIGLSGKQRFWGYVSLTSDRPEDIRDELGPQKYNTKTRGERHVNTALPAGEGVYRIVNHNGHTHLAYILELPTKTGVVQNQLNIEGQASYIITIKNPDFSSAPNTGLSENSDAQYPEQLQTQFEGKRFSELETTEFLNYKGTQFILIASSENVKDELGVVIKSDDETISSADIFEDLKIDRKKRPLKPLFEGEW